MHNLRLQQSPPRKSSVHCIQMNNTIMLSEHPYRQFYDINSVNFVAV